MPVEVERKFLVLEHDPSRLRDGQAIEQGYLSFEPMVRVRVRAGRATLTIKGLGLKRRAEYEYPVPLDEAQDLLALCTARVVKTRYVVGNLEIDVFRGRLGGLVIAEVEGMEADQPITPPDWLKWIEVTDDARYQNVNLARFGRP
jgi:adenylate cyclase